MSERPTEALQRRIDGDGQGLMFKHGQPVPMRPVPISELREAADTIAALTAEVGRLRGLLDDVRTDMTRRGQGGACNGCGEFADDGCTPHCLFTEIDAVLAVSGEGDRQ